MARTWTEAQLDAINTRDRTLLVSAAAGSGKTATLTERIISSVLDKNDPMNVEDMLIVTYTRAAVGEMRERISKAVKEALKNDPDNAHLEKQLHMLPSARISTIDAFCADILRANVERVGISPNFRVPDGAEAQLLAENILDGLLYAIYEGQAPEVATPKELDALTDCLAQARKQSELPVIIRKIYASTLNSLEGVHSLFKLVDEFDPAKFNTVEATGFGKYITSRLEAMLSHYKSAFIKDRREIENIGNPKHSKIIDMIDDALSLIDKLEGRSYEEIRTVLAPYEFKKAASVSKKDGLPPVNQLRDSFRGDVIDMREKFFKHPECDWRIAYEGLYRQFDVLYRVIKEFDRLFRQEKVRRGICEFSDVERYTYECLWQDGKPTDVAREQAKLYRAIYIDEYQDVNSLQNKIFEAISTDTNRFMVGDIKQSIYEFRSANPSIFKDMKKSYPELHSDGDFPEASIFMSNNFRCDEGIIDFVNDIFDKIFYHLRKSIEYVNADRLTFSKVYDKHPAPEYAYPEICLVPAIAKSDPRAAIAPKHSDLIAEVVARKIKELIDEGYLDNGDKIQAKDIAIIMRKVKHRGERFSRELAKLGIPSALAETERFFINSDVLLVLCLLNSIDNPHKDVYLAGLMCSPIYSFSVGDIAVIRKQAPADTLYDSLVAYSKVGKDRERVKKFLDKLEYYRLTAEGMATDRLLMKLYHETGLLALASNNKESKDNLMLLYEHARKFEGGSFKGLYNFISYINQLTGRESDFDKREAPGECDAVRIVTAHGSKGLEYPIVFFVGGDASFNQSTGAEEQPRFEYEEGFGMGMFLRTDSGLALVHNSTKDIIKDYRHRKKIEEEARILYVILTRAREKLFVVSGVPANEGKFEDEVEGIREYLSEYSVYNVSSFLRMILAAKSFNTKSPTEFLKNPPFVYTEAAYSAVPGVTEDAKGESGWNSDTDDGEITLSADNIDSLAEELKARFNFVYPDEHLTRLPGKMSVSRLYPAILDGSDEFAVKIDDGEENDSAPEDKRGYLPKFRAPDKVNRSAERGIATHMFMQFCDLERLKKNGAVAERNALKAGGFLSENEAELVRLREIDAFISSRLIREMCSAKRIYREFRFNVKLPASEFTTEAELKALYENEAVLVQGVIDCLYEDESGELHLVDYKTDRLTPEELADRELARRKLYKKHSLQLSYYAKAVELIFGKYPKTIEVYSLPLGDTLDVGNDTI